jgi:hypothetical protein
MRKSTREALEDSGGKLLFTSLFLNCSLTPSIAICGDKENQNSYKMLIRVRDLVKHGFFPNEITSATTLYSVLPQPCSLF